MGAQSPSLHSNANSKSLLHMSSRYTWIPSGYCICASAVQLIHMDLKSKNILLNARRDLAKIADVGLSRIIQSTLGGAGSTPFGVGTFEYTAPEILLGRQCNEKVIWWSTLS